ncbi:hypothetical protein [Salinicoccus albus]|uniref:hypothetical protein n=1 Tax=Salinicoccus albus TaxID=418756 RepID=UPI0003A92026|nr:hypothetical protein [Salinicoccus albus]
MPSHLLWNQPNLKHVTALASHTGLTSLSHRQYCDLLVIQKSHRQQGEMFEAHSPRIDEHIVSIHQPHVRLVFQ